MSITPGVVHATRESRGSPAGTADAAPGDPTGGPDPSHPARILLVEDSLELALVLRCFLESKGIARVTHVQDGLHGAKLARDPSWDLVISDLNLPGAGGADVIRASRERHPDRPVLVITAYTGDEVVERALRDGASEVLHKPMDPDVFLSSVAALVGRPRAEEASSPRKVLAIGTHPLDVELGCGGILMRHRDRGDRIVIVTLLHGGGSVGEAFSRLSAASARRLGADLVLGDPTWQHVPEDAERFIEGVVQRVRPDFVYAPSASDTDPDRRRAFHSSVAGSRDVPNVFSYQALSASVAFRPRLFVDVTSHLEEKVAMVCGNGNMAGGDSRIDENLVRSTARYWGRFSRFSAVEPLEVVRGPS